MKRSSPIQSGRAKAKWPLYASNGTATQKRTYAAVNPCPNCGGHRQDKHGDCAVCGVAP